MKEYRKPVRICSLEALHRCVWCERTCIDSELTAETKRRGRERKVVPGRDP